MKDKRDFNIRTLVLGKCRFEQHDQCSCVSIHRKLYATAVLFAH